MDTYGGFARSPSVIFFENATSLPEGGLETGDDGGVAAGVGERFA